MFKRSIAGGQSDLFNSIYHQVGAKKSAELEDLKGWHNIFFKYVTNQIDESIFSPLFSKNMGRSNSSIRQLLSMMILKEGNNWTDEQLFEEVGFNIKVMLALGQSNFKDAAPSPSTYYKFRSRVVAYDAEHGTDLFGDFFVSHAQGIAKSFGIKGQKVRMDSKLFSSNIAKSTRLQLIVKSLRNWLKQKSEQELTVLSKASQEVLARVAKHHAERFTFRMAKKEEKEWLEKCGLVIKEIVDKQDDDTGLLARILSEQYKIIEVPSEKTEDTKEEKIELKDAAEISGNTIQSPHDLEATYRRKQNGNLVQSVRGYASNITETCSEDNDFNIITSVQTESATHSDDQFFQQAIETSQVVLGDEKIEEAATDGSYHSPANVAYAKGKNGTAPFTFYTQAIQGTDGNFDYEWLEGKELKVTDKRTGKTYLATKTSNGKYRIKLPKGYHYILPKTIENYFLRKEIEKNKVYITTIRANVEGTIHQVFHTLNGRKSKYRGLKKNHFYVILRSIWANFRRLAKYVGKTLLKALIIAFFALKWLQAHHSAWWRNFRIQSKIPKIDQIKFGSNFKPIF